MSLLPPFRPRSDPKVEGLVYIATFAPDAGESAGSLGAGVEPPPSGAEVRPDAEGYLKLTQSGGATPYHGNVPGDFYMGPSVPRRSEMPRFKTWRSDVAALVRETFEPPGGEMSRMEAICPAAAPRFD